MVCPKCRELGIHGSFFCSQACFKGYWGVHKKLHKQFRIILREAAAKARKPLDAATLEARGDYAGDFTGFKFTSSLRPHKVTPQMVVPDIIPKPDYAFTGISPSEQLESRRPKTVVNTPEQIAAMRKTCRVARAVMDEAAALIRPGVTCDAIDRAVFAACVKRGAYPSPLNYNGFPKSVCTSVNDVVCHGIPDARPLENGDIVNLDVSVFIGGHHSDMNETFLVGEVDEEGKRLVRCAFECLREAIAICKPGVMYREVGEVISKVARKDGFSVVKRYCGHGVHRLFHCAPNVPHYRNNKATGVMKEGHTFTIEPMINAGAVECEEWPDGWTAVTRDGSRSAQFEHTLLVTKTGVEVLTAPGVDKAGTATPTSIEWDEARYQRPLPETDADAKPPTAASASSSSASSGAGDEASSSTAAAAASE